MYKIIFPNKDATIYEYAPETNSGSDEILELNLYQESDVVYSSRSLLQFDISKFDDILELYDYNDYTIYLRLWSTESIQIPSDLSLQFYNVTSEWVTGYGRWFNEPVTKEGVSWKYKNTSTQDEWDTLGGDFDNSSMIEYFLKEKNLDVMVDITTIFDEWKNQEINRGVLIKRNDELTYEGSSQLKYFGRNTHTVYVPELILAVDDYEYLADSLDPIYPEDLFVKCYNIKDYHKSGSKYRFRVLVKNKYEKEPFVENRINRVPKYLAEGTLYYSITDKIAQKTIVPFSKYSKLSLDPDGYFFTVDFSNYMPDRYYELTFKFESDAHVEYFDSNKTFKVVN